jgi:hypothetical protein
MFPSASTDARCHQDEDCVRAVLFEALLVESIIHPSGGLAKAREAIRLCLSVAHGNQSSTEERLSSIRLIHVLTMN